MSMLSPFLPRPVRTRASSLTTDADQLFALAAELDGRPVPGVRMTERQFLQWHVEGVRAEWDDGQVLLMTRTSDDHSALNIWFVRLVGDFVEHHELGEVRGPEFGVRPRRTCCSSPSDERA